MTPSSAGWTPAVNWYSQSAVGNSLAINWGGGQSLAGNSLSLAGGFTSLNGAFGTPVTLAGAGPGAWRPTRPQTIADPTGALSQFTQGGQLVGFLSDLTQDELIRVLTQNGGAGLDRFLAQPFNVLLTWGPGAFDIDLHMTGPNGSGDCFHIYYAGAIFRLGLAFALRCALLLAGLVLSGRTTWQRWTVLANPGLVYLALVTAAMAAPEPIAKVLTGYGFNLSWLTFFIVSVSTRPNAAAGSP